VYWYIEIYFDMHYGWNNFVIIDFFIADPNIADKDDALLSDYYWYNWARKTISFDVVSVGSPDNTKKLTN